MVQASLALLASKLGTRGGSRLRLLKSPVTLTEAATERIKELLAKRHKVSQQHSLKHLSEAILSFSTCTVAGVPQAGHQAPWLQRIGLHTELRRWVPDEHSDDC